MLYIVIYTDGPTSDVFPRNEYTETMIRIIVFFQFGHFDVISLSFDVSVE